LVNKTLKKNRCKPAFPAIAKHTLGVSNPILGESEIAGLHYVSFAMTARFDCVQDIVDHYKTNK
jgi:hypothetical protein